ncbi:hypothetical protein LY76DRAFT_298445 [Colletotrichum caudatum]|nr:hypothetical protein LY76DRAFT_298445 [Colletotrichum caudatum]
MGPKALFQLGCGPLGPCPGVSTNECHYQGRRFQIHPRPQQERRWGHLITSQSVFTTSSGLGQHRQGSILNCYPSACSLPAPVQDLYEAKWWQAAPTPLPKWTSAVWMADGGWRLVTYTAQDYECCHLELIRRVSRQGSSGPRSGALVAIAERSSRENKQSTQQSRARRRH